MEKKEEDVFGDIYFFSVSFSVCCRTSCLEMERDHKAFLSHPEAGQPSAMSAGRDLILHVCPLNRGR